MNDSRQITIGILIPTFNRRTYLERSLNSACGQTYKNLEILVIDNGSTDGTVEFMSNFVDERVRYVANKANIGMIGSINKGINLFSDKVEWCAILSDDDLLDKDCIGLLVRAISNTRAGSIVHSHRIFIDKDGNRTREAALSPGEETALDYLKMRSQSRRETYLTGVMFNRKTFSEIAGYPAFATGLATDDAFIFALALRDRLVFERDAISYIRIHEGAESVAGTEGLKKMNSILQFGEYCKKVANESSAFSRDQLSQLENVLKIYLRNLSSGWWIASVHFVSRARNHNDKQFAALLQLVHDRPHLFTFRIRFAVACHKMFGFFPEAYDGYRSLWRHYIDLTRLLSRRNRS